MDDVDDMFLCFFVKYVFCNSIEKKYQYMQQKMENGLTVTDSKTENTTVKKSQHETQDISPLMQGEEAELIIR